MIKLWSINRWLRWTGFVLIVEADDRPTASCTSQGVCPSCDKQHWPTRLGFEWVGWPPEHAWSRRVARREAERTAWSAARDPGFE
jgi:hypothetical protein